MRLELILTPVDVLIIKKIVDSRFTKTELKQIANKATELIDRRISKTK